jgi:hypothetical protein
MEDRIQALAEEGRAGGSVAGIGMRNGIVAIDAALLDLPIEADEWDILYRLRLQMERDLLAGNRPGTESSVLAIGAAIGSAPSVRSRGAPRPAAQRPAAGGVVGGRS